MTTTTSTNGQSTDQVTNWDPRNLEDGALGLPVPSPAERAAMGRARRRQTPRPAHAAWEPTADRPDPVEVLIEQNRTRLPDLAPLRNRRMLESPFAYLRGSALMMALDLATTPSCGLEVQLCGDAHLVNFGLFSSPERELLFDLNDFDETSPGPFEWDVKRLATSVYVASMANGFTPKDARRCTEASMRSYRQWIERYSEMPALDIWYAKIKADDLVDLMSPSDRLVTRKTVDKAMERDHVAALAKLTTVVDGVRRIVADPPLVTRISMDERLTAAFPAMLDEYRASLSPERLALFDCYRFVDAARKVVGVGSVGTRCFILLFQGPNGGPLFLQAKEAGVAAPERALGGPPARHNGERVVLGQRKLQSASDVLLGWTTSGDGVPLYVRQMWDAKGSTNVSVLGPAAMATYAGGCGWALARAHARTGDSNSIGGYLGSSARFDQAVTTFAEAYAAQMMADHARMSSAADNGLIPVSPAGTA